MLNATPEIKGVIPSEVHLVLLYPQHYKRIVDKNDGQEIYVEDFMRCGRSYDKHFWVPASEVDWWRNLLDEAERRNQRYYEMEEYALKMKGQL